MAEVEKEKEKLPKFHPDEYVIVKEGKKEYVGDHPLIKLAHQEKIPGKITKVTWAAFPHAFQKELGAAGDYEYEVIIHPHHQKKPFFFFEMFLDKADDDQVRKAKRWVLVS